MNDITSRPARRPRPVTVDVDIDADRQHVFDHLVELGNHESFTDHFMLDWQLSGPASGIGAHATVTVRALGATDHVDIEIIDVEPGEMIVERSRAGSSGRIGNGTYRLVDRASGGTHVSFEFRWIKAPLGDRITAPVTRAVVRRANQRALDRLALVLAPGETSA